MVVKEILDGVVYVGLFGGLDSYRMNELTKDILDGVLALQADQVILDFEGIPMVDTAIADRIIKLVHAVNLLGSKTIVCGFQPEVAQAMIHVGVHLTELSICRNLKTSMQEIFKRREVELTASVK
ncbi:MAG: STAS domain-containing protein, partial [Candidatus Omnitrophica bacterium]|nr:STAS domain-containing protein [Candidatus Omnitrophota bacterium]